MAEHVVDDATVDAVLTASRALVAVATRSLGRRRRTPRSPSTGPWWSWLPEARSAWWTWPGRST